MSKITRKVKKIDKRGKQAYKRGMITLDNAMELHIDWLETLDEISIGLPSVLEVSQARGDDIASESISISIMRLADLQRTLRDNVNHIGYWQSVAKLQ